MILKQVSYMRGGYFDLDEKKLKIEKIEGEMEDSSFWIDTKQSSETSKELSDYKSEVLKWEDLLIKVRDLKEISSECDKIEDESFEQELIIDFKRLLKLYKKYEFDLLFTEEFDSHNAILSFHSGSGGTEAQDWAEMLLRMIFRYCDKRKFKAELLHKSVGSEAGIKSAIVRVTGKYAYGYLKSESGVHRLVRISPFDAEKMRHTSFALIEVIPELEDVEAVEIKPEDLRIDTFLASGHGGQSVQTTYSAVRLVHIPTSITVSCQNERSQQRNKETAMKILKSKLYQVALAERDKQKKEIKGEHVSAGWGNQIRSYVLHPYKMVKDHRNNYEEDDPNKVLDGEINGFVENYLKWLKET